MELPSKILEQIAFNTRPKYEEHMLNVMDKSILERHLAQPLQINIRHFKIAVAFLTGYNGIFNVTTSNNEFYLIVSINGDDFKVIPIPPGAYA